MTRTHLLEVFIISMRTHRYPRWYFYTLKEEPSVTGVVWTPHLEQARFFPDEETVEEFKMNFISPRNVTILRI